MLQQLEPAQFRQKIAGLVDPERQTTGSEAYSISEEAVRFATILASLFGDDLDRLTLWDRISSALITAYRKSPDDLEVFVNHCLEHIKAEHSRVAASEPLSTFLATMESRDQSVKKSFLSHIERRYFILIVKARARWQEVKAGRIEL